MNSALSVPWDKYVPLCYSTHMPRALAISVFLSGTWQPAQPKSTTGQNVIFLKCITHNSLSSTADSAAAADAWRLHSIRHTALSNIPFSIVQRHRALQGTPCYLQKTAEYSKNERMQSIISIQIRGPSHLLAPPTQLKLRGFPHFTKSKLTG